MKYDAFGTILQVGDGATPEVFTAVAHLTNIEGPGVTAEVRDATTHDSPGRAREKRAGFLDAGQVNLTGYYDPQHASHKALIDAAKTGEIKNFKIIDVDDANSETTFSAFFADFRVTRPFDGMLGFTATLEVTGLPTFAEPGAP